MNILWLCNVEPPAVSEAQGKNKGVYGGWLDDMSRRLLLDHSLTIAYMGTGIRSGTIGKLSYLSFNEASSASAIKNLLDSSSYDLIHIWGTEYSHSYEMVKLLKERNLLDRCVVSIQGLISECAIHYCDGLPEKVISGRTLRDLLLRTNVDNDRKRFARAGQDETELLRTVSHVMGRTAWDEEHVKAINPKIIYHLCNESLRKCFYEGQWDPDLIDAHSIFISQCSYPLKGLHFLLEAMPVILKSFPDAKIVTSGRNIMDRNLENLLRSSRYNVYLKDLIRKYDLKDKIIFKGTLSAEEMKAEYLKANVFVCPSTIENSSNSIGEAMLLGCPVVASCVGGNPSMVRDNEEGYLYTVDSKEMLAGRIIKVFSDKESTKRISKNAREKALKTHDPENNYSALTGIYAKIIG